MSKISEKSLKTIGLPARFHDANWQSMKDHGLAVHFEKYIVNKKLVIDKGIGCFIGGNPSTGKSYAAAVIAKNFRHSEYSVQWLDAEEAYDLLAWNRDYPDAEYGNWQNRTAFVDLLIIDNFGAEKAANRKKILFDLLKRRVENKKPTIITTRLTPKGVAEIYEDNCSFLMESMKFVALNQKIESPDARNLIKDNF